MPPLFVWVQIKNFSLIWRPLPLQGCKFWPILSTNGHWTLSLRVLWCVTPMTRGIHLQWSSPRTRDTRTCCRAFSSGAVTISFTTLLCRFEHQTIRMWNKCSDRLWHHRGPILWVLQSVCRVESYRKKKLKYELSPFHFQFTLKSEFKVLIV